MVFKITAPFKIIVPPWFIVFKINVPRRGYNDSQMQEFLKLVRAESVLYYCYDL